MAFYRERPVDDWWYEANLPDKCFTCGQTARFPLVYWAGENGKVIWLHAKCAEKLGINFLQDAILARSPIIQVHPQRHQEQ